MSLTPDDESDEMILNRIRLALADPAKREQVKAMFSDPGSSLGHWGSSLSSIGRSLSATHGTAGAAGAGLGAGLGLVLRGLRGTQPKQRPLGQTNPVAATAAPDVEPNLSGPAGQVSTPAPPPPAPELPPAPSIAPSSRLSMGVDAHGNNVHSNDGGKTWVDDHGNTAAGQIYQQTQIMRSGGRFADKRAIEPEKKHVMPVISTTIVIAKKPKKPEAKKQGGPIKPKAIPPKRGPEPEGPPAPFKKGGHVQVPRGSGCAVRGKHFRGIY